MKKILVSLTAIALMGCYNNASDPYYEDYAEPDVILVDTMALDCTDWRIYAEVYSNDTIELTAQKTYRMHGTAKVPNEFYANLARGGDDAQTGNAIFAGTTNSDNAIKLLVPYDNMAGPLYILSISGTDLNNNWREHKYICRTIE